MFAADQKTSRPRPVGAGEGKRQGVSDLMGQEVEDSPSFKDSGAESCQPTSRVSGLQLGDKQLTDVAWTPSEPLWSGRAQPNQAKPTV